MITNITNGNEADKKVVVGKSNEVTITSLEIAELTGKRHDHILRDIEDILGKIRDVPKFGEIYKDARNREQKCYRLPEIEALILISGYSVELREKIILRLEYLENQLKANLPQLPQTYGEALRALADEVEAKERLALQIQKEKPLVDFAKQIAQTTNAISVRDFSKILHDENIQMGEEKLFAWLRDSNYLMSDNTPYQKFIDSGYFEVREGTFKSPYGEKSYTKTLITGKGQIYFCEKLRRLNIKSSEEEL